MASSAIPSPTLTSSATSSPTPTCNSNSFACGAPASATLYLFAFLSAFLIILGIGSWICARAFVRRRALRRLGLDPQGFLPSAVPKALPEKPRIYDVYLSPSEWEARKGASEVPTWDTITPVAAAYVLPPSLPVADTKDPSAPDTTHPAPPPLPAAGASAGSALVMALLRRPAQQPEHALASDPAATQLQTQTQTPTRARIACAIAMPAPTPVPAPAPAHAPDDDEPDVPYVELGFADVEVAEIVVLEEGGGGVPLQALTSSSVQPHPLSTPSAAPPSPLSLHPPAASTPISTPVAAPPRTYSQPTLSSPSALSSPDADSGLPSASSTTRMHHPNLDVSPAAAAAAATA